MGNCAKPRATPRPYRNLPAPHDRVGVRVYVHGPKPDNVIIKYRGTDVDMIAAGIVPAGFFTPCRGKRREDKAGRWMHFVHIRGVTQLNVCGDPLLEPRLPGVTAEQLAAAFALEASGNTRQVQEVLRPELDPGPITLGTYLQAAAIPLTNLTEIAANFSPRLSERVALYLGKIAEAMDIERERIGTPRRRPEHLRLVIDNTVRP